ncbi:MAG: hypothetical protein C4316_10855 [Chloroflexota bacterium]
MAEPQSPVPQSASQKRWHHVCPSDASVQNWCLHTHPMLKQGSGLQHDLVTGDAVILFGSFTRKDIHEGSDVDIVMIADFYETLWSRRGAGFRGFKGTRV